MTTGNKGGESNDENDESCPQSTKLRTDGLNECAMHCTTTTLKKNEDKKNNPDVWRPSVEYYTGRQTNRTAGSAFVRLDNKLDRETKTA